MSGKWKDEDLATTSKSVQVEEEYSAKKSTKKTLPKMEEFGNCCTQDRRILRYRDLGAPDGSVS